MKQGIPKILFFALLLVIGLFSCKKDKDNNSKQLYLSKEFKDGLLEVEFFYTPDKKPIRKNFYSTGNGISYFSSFRLYEYNSDKLLETMTEFSKNNTFINKYRITYDADKRPSRLDDLAADNTIQWYHIFDYNAQGDLSKFSIFNATTLKKTIEGNISYDAHHKVTKIIRTNHVANPTTLQDSSTFVFNTKTLPTNWNYWENLVFVSLPKGDRLFMDMTCDSSYYYDPDTPPITHKYIFSGKQYNAAGYLIKQHVNLNQSFFQSATSDYDLTYEYIQE